MPIIVRCFFFTFCFNQATIAVTGLVADVIVYNKFPIYQVRNEGYLKNRPSSLLVFGTERPPDLEQVLFRRDPDTGLGTSLPDQSVVRMVAPFSTSSEYSKVALFLPVADGQCTNTGSYTVTLRQQKVEVTALKMPDQAPLKPVEFTRRVFVGESVSVEIRVDTQYYNYTAPIYWRHNGKSLPWWNSQQQRIHSVLLSDGGVYEFYQSEADRTQGRVGLLRLIVSGKSLPWWNSQQQRIHSVLLSDGGVYEFYQSEADRTQGRVGLLRLIVSECEPLIWGRACSEHCPICHNGGVCDQLMGECICPPGFKGKYCEHACEESWFDAGCTSRCGAPDEFGGRSCSSYLFCMQDPFGCSCASGFHGIHCNDECENGLFGAGCTLKCHCAGGKQCNRVTGHCEEGCALGYSGDSCQTNDNTAELLAFYNRRTNPGQDTEFVCALQMSKRPLITDCKLQAPDGTIRNASGTSFLGRNYPYKWSFLIPDTQLGSYNCIFRDKLMTSAEIRFYALPRLKDAPEAFEVGSSHVIIKWNSWTRFYDYGDGPIKGYKLWAAQNRHQAPRQLGIVTHVEGKQFYKLNATGLRSHTNYTFYLQTIREGREGTGQPGNRLRVETKCDAAKLSSERVEVVATQSNRIVLRWKSTPCGDPESTLAKYQYEFASSPDFKHELRRGFEDGETHVEDQLDAYTQYYFRVRPILLSGVKGQWSQVVNTHTSQARASAPLDFQIICSDSNSITVGWKPPLSPRGRVDQYEIKYDKSYDSLNSVNIYRNNMYSLDLPDVPESSARYATQLVDRTNSQRFEMKIDKLEPNSTYYFRVRAKNGFGEGEWSHDAVGKSEFSVCLSSSALSGRGALDSVSSTANVAVICAIFVGVVLTITIIIAAAIGYFGINCSVGGEKERDKDSRTSVPYKIATLARHGGSTLNQNQIEMIEQTYLSNPDCGLRLSNYHQETDSLINEAIGNHSRTFSGGTLSLPRGSTGSTNGFASMRVHHSPGKITRIPVGPGSLDQPDFFERRAPDGNENNPIEFGLLSRRREEKKLMFSDQVSVRGRGRSGSQHDDSHHSSIKSELNRGGLCVAGGSGGGGGGVTVPRSPTGSMQGIMVDFSSRPSSVSPPRLSRQNTLQAQVTSDSSCLVVTPTDTHPPPFPNQHGLNFKHAPYNPNTIRAMEKKMSLDSQSFYKLK
ncbi:uncharacterized protein LOC134844951 [Symsagittifera roscoffensis]|uniref:uncharacterized protein LOC134844951 n=1 Tax=Symsagittifera roscoffensis TaxID=84072 RepID=UPI00307BED0C